MRPNGRFIEGSKVAGGFRSRSGDQVIVRIPGGGTAMQIHALALQLQRHGPDSADLAECIVWLRQGMAIPGSTIVSRQSINEALIVIARSIARGLDWEKGGHHHMAATLWAECRQRGFSHLQGHFVDPRQGEASVS